MLVWFILRRTTFGFEVRTVGANPHAARYAGMGVNRTIILVMAISGAFAGIAGASEITGTSGFLSPGVFVGIGFDAIAIALLARANPFGIILTSILWGSMLSGAGLMQQESGLSIDAVRIIQALVLLFVAADVIVRTIFRVRSAPSQSTAGHHAGRLRHGGVRVKRLRFGRRQTIGVLFGLLGVRPRRLRRRQPRGRRQGPHLRTAARSGARSAVDPPIVVAAIGIDLRARAPSPRSSSAAGRAWPAARSCSPPCCSCPLVDHPVPRAVGRAPRRT